MIFYLYNYLNALYEKVLRSHIMFLGTKRGIPLFNLNYTKIQIFWCYFQELINIS